MAMVTVEVEFNDDGSATVKLPGGKSERVKDPAKVALLTEDISKALGPIIERHQANAHSHIHKKDGNFVQNEGG